MTCAIIISCTLLPCDYTLVKLASLTAALSTGIATLSSLAQLWVWSRGNTGCDDARLTKSGNSRSKQLLVSPTEQLTDWEWLSGEPLNGLNVSFFFSYLFSFANSRSTISLLHYHVLLVVIYAQIWPTVHAFHYRNDTVVAGKMKFSAWHGRKVVESDWELVQLRNEALCCYSANFVSSTSHYHLWSHCVHCWQL